MPLQKWVSVAAGNPGGRARVEKGQRMGRKGVWLSFEAETQRNCDVEDANSFAHTTSGKVQNIGALLRNLKKKKKTVTTSRLQV